MPTFKGTHGCKAGMHARNLRRDGWLQVLDVARRLPSSGPESLAALRDAGLLEACLFIVKSNALDSHNAKCAITLVGRFAEWDDDSRWKICLRSQSRKPFSSECC